MSLEMKEYTGAPIAAHKLDAEWPSNGKHYPIKPRGFRGRMMVMLFRFMKRPAPPIVKPDIVIDGEFDLNQFGVDAKVIHTPGHTPGLDICNYLGGRCNYRRFVIRRYENQRKSMLAVSYR